MPYFSVTQGAVAKGRCVGGRTRMKSLAKNAREHLYVVPCVPEQRAGVTHPAGRGAHS